MPTLIDSLIPVADDARGIAQALGQRDYRVDRVIITSTLEAGRLTETETEDVLTIAPRPKVKWARRWQGEVQGLTSQSEPTVSKVSKTYTRTQLDPDDSAEGTRVVYRIYRYVEDGDDVLVATCRLQKIKLKTLGWELQMAELR